MDDQNKKRSIRDIPIPDRDHSNSEIDNEPNNTINNNEEVETTNQSEPNSNVIDLNKNQEEPVFNNQSDNEVFIDLEEDEKKEKKVYKKDKIKVRKYTNPETQRRIKYSLIIILVIVVGIFTVISQPGAVVSIEAKEMSVNLNKEVDAFNVSVTNSSSTNPNALKFSTKQAEEELTEIVRSSGKEEVEDKSSGRIRVFNNFTENNQRLIANTRFESPDGLIYRIQDSITVPGKTGDTPGSIDVQVFADKAGEEFNKNEEDIKFTIPGFEGQPQFDGFYAESLTGFSGGFVGTRNVISDEDKSIATENLKNKLKDSIKNKLNNDPAGDNLMFTNLDSLKFEVVSEEESKKDSDSVELKMKAYATVISINKEDFSRKIAEENISAFDTENEKIEIMNLTELSLEIKNEEEVSENTQKISVGIQGDIVFIWITEEKALKEALKDEKKEDMRSILESFPGIAKAEVIIKPFWSNDFPSNENKIEIELNDSKKERCDSEEMCSN